MVLSLHRPVLVDEVLNSLRIIPNGVYVDCTFGQGGHSEKLFKHLSPQGQVIAIDKDPAAAAYVIKHFPGEKRLTFHYHSFAQLKEIVMKHHLVGKVDGILLDLGTSATQLETPERGFSFLRDGPLDMRMNPSQGESAAYWIATVSITEMINVFKTYGEERWAKRIALAIDQARKHEPIKTTNQLAHIIKEAHPRWPRKIHPATRIFQAIRIYVNQEMEELLQGLVQSAEVLAPGGRLSVITFHSLEARIVKKFMRSTTLNKGFTPEMRWVDTGVKPTAKEIASNPRARSAILRVMEKNV